MIRTLSLRPLNGYLNTHYFNSKPCRGGQFVMGCGAIFMIQRVRDAEASLTASSIAEETDTTLLREMLSLITLQKLDIIPLKDAPQRLAEGNYERRFVCFTFDGAYRSVLETVQPLFSSYKAPYTVYAGSDFLKRDRLPGWMALETLVRGVDRIVPMIDGLPLSIPNRTPQEKREAYQTIAEQLAPYDTEERTRILHNECERHDINITAQAEKELLSAAELKTLAEDPLVTIGSHAGGIAPLREQNYDDAKENISQSLDALEEALGERPRHMAFPGGHSSHVSVRDLKIAADLGLETAVTGLEGALWPENAETTCALPRIALSNDPATLTRVLMLGDTQLEGEITAVGRKIA
ncbi:MAG: polysaccharide deacetylase family protein [Alphaproteobacteria bacterium]